MDRSESEPPAQDALHTSAIGPISTTTEGDNAEIVARLDRIEALLEQQAAGRPTP